MIGCDTRTVDPFRCPTKWELWPQVMALLPRGRAWQTHDAGMDVVTNTATSQVGSFEVGLSGVGEEAFVMHLTVLQKYWLAFAEVLEFLHLRACALIEEMFCATTTELRSEWGFEYGYPDACEPFDSLCAKVRALGGSTCAYLETLAARLGYTIECVDCDGRVATSGCLEAGLTPLDCDCQRNEIRVRISGAPVPIAPPIFEAGAIVAGCTSPCPATPEQVVCLIERFKPAHVRAIYEVVTNV